MRIRIRRILLRLLGLDLVARELTRLLFNKLNTASEAMKQELTRRALRLLLLAGLAQAMLLFGLCAGALYLNHLLDSSYQGFGIVASGCAAMLLVLFLRYRRWSRNTWRVRVGPYC